MNPVNIFLWQDTIEQQIARRMYVDMFQIYADQLIKMMQDNEYTINEMLKN